MTIKLFNTMTRKTEEFKPLVPGKMGFYSFIGISISVICAVL